MIQAALNMLKYTLFFATFQVLIVVIAQPQNNVCKTFIGYFFPAGNPDCYFDPDTLSTTPELIKKYTGKVETHQVISDDGYIITMFRIPPVTTPKGVILVHHSVATHSRIYLWQGNNSLVVFHLEAVTLWRNGFDVWLADHRGTNYSSKHVNITSDDIRYWDFSVHEMGLFDVSKELELIRNKTNNGSKIIFLGHSLGSGVGLVYAALKPEEAKNYLKTMVLVSAPYNAEHTTSLLPLLLKTTFFQTFVKIFKRGSPSTLISAFIPISRTIFRAYPFLMPIVKIVLWLWSGYTPNEVDPTFFNYDMAVYLNSFSWRTIVHFLQVAHSNRSLHMFDYGKEKNLQIYGEAVPPLYPVDKISVPTLLVSSYDDGFITLKDTENLFSKLSPEAKVHGHWKLSGLNHVDYLFGLHRKEIFMDKLLVFLNGV